MGVIYRITNKINEKNYIGQTCNFFQRKSQHISNPRSYSAFDCAIKKYGKDNFEWKIIDKADDQNVLNMLERLHISRYESMTHQWGYNIREGGSNGKLSKKTKEKMSIVAKGKEHTITHRMKVGKAKQGNFLGFIGSRYSNPRKINPWKRVWQSRIQFNHKITYLGYYNDPLSAQIVYEFVCNEIYKDVI